VVAHALDQLVLAVEARSVNARSALDTVNELAAAAIQRRNFAVAEPFHACSCKLVSILDDSSSTQSSAKKQRKRKAGAASSSSSAAAAGSIVFKHNNIEYELAAAHQRSGVRKEHVVALLDIYAVDTNGDELATAIRDRMNALLLARGQSQTTSMRVIITALRIAFGETVTTSRSKRNGSYRYGLKAR